MNLSELLNSDMSTLAGYARSGWRWWTDELVGLLPKQWTRGESLTSWHRFERGALITASDPSADVVSIPAEMCLVRHLVLPRAPLRDLIALVDLDLDRIMPVAREMIVTGVAIAGTGPQPDTLSVRVGAVTLRDARDLAASLDAAGIDVGKLGPLAEDGETLAFDLAPAMRAAGLLPPRSQARRFWWSVVAALALTNIGIAILRDRQQVDQLQALVDAQAPALMVVRRIEDRLQANAQTVEALDAQRRKHQPVRVISSLYAALPDSAWIQRLEWDGEKVRASGFAAQGVNVVAAFKQSGAFVSVRANRAETIAVTQAGRPFDLTAQLNGGGSK